MHDPTEIRLVHIHERGNVARMLCGLEDGRRSYGTPATCAVCIAAQLDESLGRSLILVRDLDASGAHDTKIASELEAILEGLRKS